MAPQVGENMNQHLFVVVGILIQADPITVQFEKLPYVNEVLETGPGWHGVPPGTKLRVTSITVRPEDKPSFHSAPQGMICVVAL
jgi:hypothetical protein